MSAWPETKRVCFHSDIITPGHADVEKKIIVMDEFDPLKPIYLGRVVRKLDGFVWMRPDGTEGSAHYKTIADMIGPFGISNHFSLYQLT